MAEFKLGRIRFVWKNTWANATTYIKDDVVRYGGKTYVCVLGHTSTSNFYTDLTANWNLASDGQAWLGTWTASGTGYKVGDTVTYGGQVYICKTGHTSQTYLEDDQNKWDLFASAFSWQGAWIASTYYRVGELVKYGATVYRCKTGHTSNASATTLGGGLEADQNKWDILNQSFDYKGTWIASGTRYKLNDVVKEGAGLWICKGINVSASTWVADSAYWDRFVEGLEFLSTYSTSTAYVPGDVVTYGGYSYVSLTNNTNRIPTSYTGSDWSILSTGFNFRGNYSNGAAYKVGDVARLNGYTYLAIADGTGNQPPNLTYWEQLNPGYQWLGTWTSAGTTKYVLGDSVRYANSSYVCVLAHTAATPNRPDNDLTGTYWNQLAGGAETLVMTTQGDITYYGGAGPARLPIGTDGQVLTVSGSNLVWNTFGDIANIYYVATTGTDVTTNGQGTTLDKPFRTIKFACDTVAAGNSYTVANTRLQANTNWLTREMFQYMVYQKSISGAPFTPGSVFDETKSIRDAKLLLDAISQDLTRTSNANTVGATLAYFATNSTFYNANVTAQMPYFVAGLTYLKALLTNAINKTTPASNYQTLTSFTPAVTQVTTGGTAEVGALTALNNLMDIVLTALGTYTTTPSTASIPLPTTGQTTTIFVKTGTFSEILPISVPENTAIVGDELRGTIIQPASGYVTSNMFYMRNGTGLRNCTLQGLTGTLGAANSYGTQRPTAGAYVSLDPGAGADDPSVWIYKRSPYIQNVTTFGYAAIGMKVDGSLHNGGNRSIVVNDFTQVINDGIGAWVTNNARAELVSMFSYYAHIGYLSENGGKIRATNGNNSYGKYGAVSEYVDSTETPITAKINNRAVQAQVGYTFTNGSAIYRLEYSNAGNAYPNSGTSYTFNSAAGINAVASGDEVRDNAVFENRMLTTGTGYVTVTNTAQSGTTTGITIAASDTAISAAYLGMRVIITSGLGVGQQGYFAYYSSGTKTGIVAKETFTAITASAVTSTGAKITVPSTTTFYVNQPIVFTGTTIGGFNLGQVYYVQAILSSTQIAISLTSGGAAMSSGLSDATASTMIINAAGWDHVVVGTAINSILDSTTTYIIEPRITYSSPAYATTARTVPSGTWSSSTYANGRFVAVANASGTSAYSVDGINWTAMTGLSSSAFNGVAGGAISATTYYVAVAGGTASQTAYYSSNGTSWTTMSGLPVGNWQAVAYGNSRFVAVASGTASAWSTSGTSFNTGGSLANNTWTSIAYGTGPALFVAIAGGTSLSNATAYSVDGVSWLASTLPQSAYWTSIAWGNGRFVAVAQGGQQTAYSLDGINWTTPSTVLPAVYAWKNIAYGQGNFLATASTLTPTVQNTYTGSNQIQLSSTAGMATGVSWVPTAVTQTTTATASTTTTGTLSGGSIIGVSGALSTLTPGMANQGTISTGMAISGGTLQSAQNIAITGASNTAGTVTLTYLAQTEPLSNVIITGTAGQFSCSVTTTPLVVGQAVVIKGTFAGTGSITGYTDPTTYYIIQTNGSTTFQLSTSATGVGVVTTAGTPTGLTYTYAKPIPFVTNQTITVQGVNPITYNGTYTVTGTPTATQVQYSSTTTTTQTLSVVVITGTTGTFTCSSATLQIGQRLTISGTFGGSGSISGYTDPTSYYIIATNGTTSFTLSTSFNGGAVTTVAGTPTGVTYTLNSTYISGGTAFSAPLYITGSNTFTSTGSNISGTTLTVGTLTGGTIAQGMALTGNTSTNTYAQVMGSNLSLAGITTGTPAVGMYIGGPNITAQNPNISASNTSTFFGGIAAGTAVTFTGSITPNSTTNAGLGATLTVTTTPSGTGIILGYVLSGTGVVGGTYVAANLSGTATSSSSSWTVNISQTVASTTITATPVLLTVSGVGVGTIVPGTVMSWASGIVAQNLAITNITGNGISATVSFTTPPATIPFAVGQAITIAGNSQSVYNGTFTVTGCTVSIVTFATSSSATGTGGTVVSAGTYVTANGTGTGGTGTYYVSPAPTASVAGGTSFTGQVYTLSAPTLSSVVIAGTGGQFTCAASILAVGQTVTISGTLGGTGTITGYANPTTYYIVTTNGTTAFTLSTTSTGLGVVTTTGTPTGLTYTVNNVSYQNGSLLLNSLTGYITSNLSGTGSGSTWTVSSAFSPTGSIPISGLSYSLSGAQTAVATPVTGTTNTLTVTSSTGMIAGESVNFTGTSFGGVAPTSQTLASVTTTGPYGQFACTAANLVIGHKVTIAGNLAGSPTLSTVVITGTGGQFSCTSTQLAVGQSVTITGSFGGTGSFVTPSYVSGTAFYIIATNGTTTFTLSATKGGSAIVTTAGTPTGLTYTLNAIVDYINPTTYFIVATNGTTTFTLSTTRDGAGVSTAVGTPTGLTYTVDGTYYITNVASATAISVSTSYLGRDAIVTPATGSLSATAGSYLGGLTSGSTYYVASINQATNQIIVSASSTLTPLTTLTGNAGGAWTSATMLGAAASSQDGINWTSRAIANDRWNTLTFGNTNTSFTGSISGTTLTVTSTPTGSGIVVGAVLNGIGVIAGTTITGNLTGTQFGSSSTWTVGTSHASPTGSITITSGAPIWAVIATGGTSALSIPNFTQAQARAVVASGQISGIRIYEPGSGYTTPPTITVGDPNATAAATYTIRTGIGVLGNPTFSNRGIGYTTATTTVSGSGYADIYQNSQYININNMSLVPTPGSNVVFTGNGIYYKLVSISSLTGSVGNYSATLQVSPAMTIPLAPVHGVGVTMRILYSQVRLTGHDFLSVGTGNIAATNYPNITNAAIPAQACVESGGGRVFYTSTDQDGNFNVGNLFTVQQSTGIATLNANAFNLSGLQTLQLGAVSLGSSNTSINAFSTDGTFTSNSDSIVPTQKAIRTYIASQIGGGGSTVNVNTLTAGTIEITGSQIRNTAGTQINIKSKANFTQGIDGSPLALNYFLLR
jgi:hypothetical protein